MILWCLKILKIFLFLHQIIHSAKKCELREVRGVSYYESVWYSLELLTGVLKCAIWIRSFEWEIMWYFNIYTSIILLYEKDRLWQTKLKTSL